MSNVNLAIGGRTFMVACADGEESHITDLGRMIDDKVVASGAIAQNETRMLLFAALMLADEVHEVRSELAQTISHHAKENGSEAQLEARIDHVARRLEALAVELETQHLEDPAQTS